MHEGETYPEGNHEVVYVGRWSEDPLRTEDGEPNLEGAVRHAYEVAKEHDAKPPFRIVEIWIEGDNPISDYRVGVKPGG